MVASAAERFTPPPIPWRHPLALEPAPELGPGVDPQRSGEALARLCAEPDVQAVIVGQPQLTPAEKLACWKRFNRAPEWLPLACVRRCGP